MIRYTHKEHGFDFAEFFTYYMGYGAMLMFFPLKVQTRFI